MYFLKKGSGEIIVFLTFSGEAVMPGMTDATAAAPFAKSVEIRLNMDFYYSWWGISTKPKKEVQGLAGVKTFS